MDPGCCRTTEFPRNLGLPQSPGQQTIDTNVASRGSMDTGGLLRKSIPENEAFFILDILSLHRTRAIMQLGNVQELSQNSSFKLLHATLSTLLTSRKGICSPVHCRILSHLPPTLSLQFCLSPPLHSSIFPISPSNIQRTLVLSVSIYSFLVSMPVLLDHVQIAPSFVCKFKDIPYFFLLPYSGLRVLCCGA